MGFTSTPKGPFTQMNGSPAWLHLVTIITQTFVHLVLSKMGTLYCREDSWTPKWFYIILDLQSCQKSLWMLPKYSLCAYGSNSEQLGDPVHPNHTLSNLLVNPPNLQMGKLRSRGEQWLIQSCSGNLQNPGLLMHSKERWESNANLQGKGRRNEL